MRTACRWRVLTLTSSGYLRWLASLGLRVRVGRESEKETVDAVDGLVYRAVGCSAEREGECVGREVEAAA